MKHFLLHYYIRFNYCCCAWSTAAQIKYILTTSRGVATAPRHPHRLPLHADRCRDFVLLLFVLGQWTSKTAILITACFLLKLHPPRSRLDSHNTCHFGSRFYFSHESSCRKALSNSVASEISARHVLLLVESFSCSRKPMKFGGWLVGMNKMLESTCKPLMQRLLQHKWNKYFKNTPLPYCSTFLLYLATFVCEEFVGFASENRKLWDEIPTHSLVVFRELENSLYK